ncbi:MAG: hypothetical protein EBZ36_09655, partial [Acidobacteria bacterium]|nr:hypothetical protein [Acidobacteriota bacterium]
EPIVTVPGAKGDLRFSNDGRYLAFTSEGETVDSRNIFVKPVDSNDILQLTNNAYTDHSLTWSPDNRRIAFLREGPLTSRKNQILIVAATGGKEEVVGKAWHGLDWSPDGQSLAVCDSNGQGEPTGIHLLSLSSGQLRPISRPPPRENIFDGDPKFSPDGRSLAFTRWTSSTTGDLFITDLRTGSLRQLTFDRCRLGSIQWSSEGKELLFVSNRTGNYRVWRIPFRGGEAIPVEGVLGEVDRLSLVDSPRNERLLAYTQRYDDINIQVNSITEQGGANVPAPPCSINSTRADHSPQFSPDGTKIAFMSARTGREEIWIANADCSGVQQLTRFNEDGVGSPRWSPDGRKIAFDRHVGEQSEIFVIETDTGQVQRITDHPSADMLPAWSSDGQQLFFFSERNNASEIWKVSANGGEPTPVTRYGGRESWAASNGRDLFYTSYNSLWLKNLITNDELQISDLKGVLFGRYWTVQGTGVYYLTRETRSRCLIHRYDTQTRQTRVILELPNSPARFVPGFSISPDNSRIAISLISYNPGDISLIRGWN